MGIGEQVFARKLALTNEHIKIILREFAKTAQRLVWPALDPETLIAFHVCPKCTFIKVHASHSAQERHFLKKRLESVMMYVLLE